ncbi:Rieske Fe-S protein [Frankia casuarinae]|uniref:Cytochrome bc1 complex Rieske iron-sulfur subunit n=1 Tax=Frankia casuarinae (strain DSM 45818 / CECT 9043 / HFP020203 / CcI3) TaxID=106370 RepID=Q2JED8_FRACC|nr:MULTISPECIES: Rieske (2Fe-2S) protein [Frankia]ABD10354.1 Twin-arginine translocation pathway signal [Frankia casuarinae]ETA01431.1 Rieske Fe-S protein [Frankia sp. CcI6]EYT91682.1 Rieske Fe-S protein [Frankia casuarinae]KDA41991.1 Rieske Fe-S protein [Frankia sp. BMG5.23]KFB05510.1 Rieske Fe-S protein [Frankia sp. Allo2]
MTQEAPTRRLVVPGIAVTVAAGAVGYVVASSSDAADPKPRQATAGGTRAGGDGSGAGNGGGQAGGAAPLARVDEVPADGGLILGDAGLVLTRNAAGTIQGFSTVCTHQGCSVNAIAKGRILCPCHGSAFDTRTGEPVAGPAKQPLPPVAVTVRDNAIFPA